MTGPSNGPLETHLSDGSELAFAISITSFANNDEEYFDLTLW